MPRPRSLNMADFDRYYTLLELDGEVKWQQVQTAYRRLAQQLHPDKTAGDPEAFHKLNLAYKDLKRYHDTFGTLPAAGRTAMGGRANTVQSQRPRGRPSQPRPNTGRRLTTIMALLAIPPIAYLLWPRPAVQPAPNRPTIAAGASDSLSSKLAQQRISLGMTKAEVLKIQGTPLIMEQREWNYGVSKIFFYGGTVTGWYNARSSPLKVSPQDYGSVGIDRRLTN